MKIIFRPKEYNKPDRAMAVLSFKVKQGIKQKQEIDLSSYYASLMGISEGFQRQNNLKRFNDSAQQLAETLVGLGKGNLAGIIYSILIKLNSQNSTIMEQLATNALAIAKRFHDPVHTMARAENLVRIYEKREFGSHKHLDLLYTEKRALVDICKDYKKSKRRFQSISSRMKPIENYERMLAGVKIKIAEIIMHKEPKAAIEELQGAKSLIEKQGSGPHLVKINNLISKLELRC